MCFIPHEFLRLLRLHLKHRITIRIPTFGNLVWLEYLFALQGAWLLAILRAALLQVLDLNLYMIWVGGGLV